MTTIAPKAPAELEEFITGLSDDGKLQDAIRSGEFNKAIKAYVKAVSENDKAMTEQVREQVQAELQAFLREQRAQGVQPIEGLNLSDSKAAVDQLRAQQALSPKAVKQGLFNKAAIGAGLDEHYDNLGQMFRMLSPRARTFKDSAELARRMGKALEIQNSYGSTIPADGGFLIPETLRSQLLMVALEDAVVRPRATVIPMESLSLSMPMVDATSNVSSVFGGMVAYWTEESAALVESQAAFGKLRMEAQKLTALAIAPNELIADATAFLAFLQQGLPATIAWYEDEAFLNGSGVGEPLGLLNNTATVVQTAESGQGAATLVWENIVKMYARMLPRSLGNAVWVVNQEVFPQLATMALSVGTGGAPVWMANGHDAPVMTLLGRPVIVTEKAAALGTTGDIAFVDFSYYLIGDRQSMQVAESEHVRFLQDQTAYRIIERVDGRPWIQSAITPKRGTNTLSPFVQLSSTRT